MSLFDFSPVNQARMPKVDPQIAAALARMNPSAVAASLPQLPDLGGPVKGPGLMQRMMNNVMPTPGALQDAGLITDDDISSAQRQGMLGLGASLLADSGPKLAKDYVTPMAAIGRGIQAMQGGYQGAVQSAAQMREGSLDYQAKKDELARRGQLRTSRENIIKKFPMPTNGDRASMLQWINTVLPHFIEANDEQTTTSLSEIYKSLGGQSSAVHPPQEIRLGNKVILRDPVTGQQVGEYPIAPSPRDPNAPDTAQQLRDQRMFNRENQLTDDFNKDTKSQREAIVKMQGAISEKDQAMNGNGASQINMLYAFVNAMDPASAVREGEIGLARAAAPVWAQAQALFNKYLTSGSVTVPPQLVQSMAGLMERRVGGYNRYINERSDYYTKRAKKWGVNSEGLFPGVSSEAGTPSPTATPSWHPPMALPGQIDPRLQGIPRKGQ